MIELENLSVVLPGFCLNALSLTVKEGEFFMIVGPSGAGKTILLEAIAGLRPLAEGTVRIEGRDVTRLPPEKRKVALVYQDYALFPHLTVDQNLRWGLRFVDDPDEDHASHLVELFRLGQLLHRRPGTLSGGEQQRVALARALAVKPSLLLLDEPLSALDPSFREDLQDYLGRINREGMTLIMVTHDFGEVLSLGSRVAVVSEGALQQVGDVRSVFREPKNRLVGEFVGMKNFFSGTIGKNRAVLDEKHSLAISGDHPSGPALLGLRPEDVVIGSTRPAEAENAFFGRVVSIIPRGMTFEVVLQIGGMRLTGRVLSSVLLAENITLSGMYWMSFTSDSIHVFKNQSQSTEVCAS